MDEQRLARLREAVEAFASAGAARPASVLTGRELVAVNAAFGALRTQVDAAFAPYAAELARQSRPELGSDSLAKKQGFRTPASLIAATGAGTTGDAVKLMRVGEATTPRQSLAGEQQPAKRPHVAEALAAGRIGVTAAYAISEMLERAALAASSDVLAEAERRLVEAAPGLTPEQLHRVVARVEAYLDPDGLEPREQALRDGRFVTLREERDGAVTLQARLDPVSGAAVKTAIDAIVTRALRTRGRGDLASEGDAERDAAETGDTEQGAIGNGGTDGAAAIGDGSSASGAAVPDGAGDGRAPAPDERTVRQMQADALVDLCRHALGCAAVPTGPEATIVVRIDLDDLESGTGSATIDGFDRPVSAGAVRRLAADARVIPAVLGGDSEILDWGRAKRLFTPAQKLALAERDGGCAFCGAPPSQTSAHHLNWWERDRGRTDLSDGVLLCTGCHHRVHDDGWDIEIRGRGVRAEVWFVPPPWIDRSRTPRRGITARLGLAA